MRLGVTITCDVFRPKNVNGETCGFSNLDELFLCFIHHDASTHTSHYHVWLYNHSCNIDTVATSPVQYALAHGGLRVIPVLLSTPGGVHEAPRMPIIQQAALRSTIFSFSGKVSYPNPAALYVLLQAVISSLADCSRTPSQHRGLPIELLRYPYSGFYYMDVLIHDPAKTDLCRLQLTNRSETVSVSYLLRCALHIEFLHIFLERRLNDIGI